MPSTFVEVYRHLENWLDAWNGGRCPADRARGVEDAYRLFRNDYINRAMHINVNDTAKEEGSGDGWDALGAGAVQAFKELGRTGIFLMDHTLYGTAYRALTGNDSIESRESREWWDNTTGELNRVAVGNDPLKSWSGTGKFLLSMVPNMAADTAVMLLAPEAYLPYIGLKSGGNKYYDLMGDEELPQWKRYLNAAGTGAVNAGLELGTLRLMRGFKLGGGTETLKRGILPWLGYAGKSTVSEGVFESLEQIGENAIDYTSGVNREEGGFWKQLMRGVPESAVGGTVFGGVLEGSFGARSARQNYEYRQAAQVVTGRELDKLSGQGELRAEEQMKKDLLIRMKDLSAGKDLSAFFDRENGFAAQLDALEKQSPELAATIRRGMRVSMQLNREEEERLNAGMSAVIERAAELNDDGRTIVALGEYAARMDRRGDLRKLLKALPTAEEMSGGAWSFTFTTAEGELVEIRGGGKKAGGPDENGMDLKVKEGAGDVGEAKTGDIVTKTDEEGETRVTVEGNRGEDEGEIFTDPGEAEAAGKVRRKDFELAEQGTEYVRMKRELVHNPGDTEDEVSLWRGAYPGVELRTFRGAKGLPREIADRLYERGSDPEMVRGYSEGNVCWVNADRVSRGEVPDLLKHEVVSHYGLSVIFGARYGEFLDAVFREHKDDALFQERAKLYFRKNIVSETDAEGNTVERVELADINDCREAASEYLAAVAERRTGFRNEGWFKSFMRKIRMLLEKWNPSWTLTHKWTDDDILDALGRSAALFRSRRAKAEKSAVAAEKSSKSTEAGGDKQRGGEFSLVGEKSGVAKRELATACLMEQFGKGAREIKLATGWERGDKDNAWRYEIADGKYIGLKLPSNYLIPLRAIWDQDELYKLYPEFELYSVRIVFKDGGLYGEHIRDDNYKDGIIRIYMSGEKEYAELEKELKEARERLDNRGNPDWDAHEAELVAKLDLEEKTDAELRADIARLEKEIEGLFDLERVEDTLRHEIQHGIQHIEGFPHGGSPKGVKAAIEKRMEEYEKEIARIDAEIEAVMESAGWKTYEQESAAALDEYLSTDTDKEAGRKKYQKEVEYLQKHIPEYKKKYDLEAKRNALYKEGKQLEELKPGKIYHRLAGKVEARNATARAGMTFEEKRKSLLWETEDLKGGEKKADWDKDAWGGIDFSQGGVSFAAPDDIASFKIALKNLEKYKGGSIRVTSNTPSVLRKTGMPKDLAITISYNVIQKAIGKRAATDGSFHTPISDDELQRLPEALYNPIMVFRSETQSDSRVILTDLSDTRGKSVIVAIRMSLKDEHVVVNSIRSIYGKDNQSELLRWIHDKNLMYIHKEKALKWAQSRGLQLPKEAFPTDKESAQGFRTIVDESIFVKQSSVDFSKKDEKRGYFSLSDYTEGERAAYIGILRPMVGFWADGEEWDYAKFLKEKTGVDIPEHDAYGFALAAAEQRRAEFRAETKRQLYEWFGEVNPIFRELVNFCGTDFHIRPSFRHQGSDFSGSFISRAWVKYSNATTKLEGKAKASWEAKRERALKEADGYHSDEVEVDNTVHADLKGIFDACAGWLKPQGD